MLLVASAGSLLSPPPWPRRSLPRRPGRPCSLKRRGRAEAPTPRCAKTPGVWSRCRGHVGGAPKRSCQRLLDNRLEAPPVVDGVLPDKGGDVRGDRRKPHPV